jgi:hypothetical protein
MAIAGNKITRAKIDADAIDGTKVADDSLDSEHYAATSIDNEHLADNAVGTDEIADDAVTYAKIQNVSATDRILGRDSASAGVIEEITPANLRTMINVEDGATADQSNAEIVAAVEAGSDSNTFTDADHSKLNGIAASANAYVHPNHSGEVTSTADGATVIADNIVDEANLKVSNAPSNGYMLTAQSGDTGGLTWAEAGGGTSNADYNMIINGDMQIATRGTTITSTSTTTNNDDDSYTLDRWVLLSDGNDIVDVKQSTDSPNDGSSKSLQLEVETADKKFGIVQIIENCNCHDALASGKVSLSFKMKASDASIDDVRAAVVAWSGTADTVTSDIVSAWEAEGTNPTLITNATYENTPADLNPTTSWAEYKIEDVTVDTSSTGNILIFIWSGVTDVEVNDSLYITDVQLESGSTANSFKRLDIETTMQQCERYYESSMTWGTTGQYQGQEVSIGVASGTFGATVGTLGGRRFRTRKRVTPTATIYHQDGTAGAVYRIHDAQKTTGIVAQHITDYGFLFASKASAFAHGHAYYYAYIAECEL